MGTARKKARGLIYLRRSGDRQETSLEKQLAWALHAAKQHAVAVDATVEDLVYMQDHGLHTYKSLRLDNAVTGSDLERPGLTALCRDAAGDRNVSHVFALKRDRLGRPEVPLDMMVIEATLCRDGITIVRSDGISSPYSSDDEVLTSIVSMAVDYHMSGKFLRDLAEQMIRTQLYLARKGLWTGGNAPFGFVRALVNERGEILEELPPGRHIRQAGCHVVIVPNDEKKIEIWIHILWLKEQGWGYKRIARHLNELGIPSPDAGRTRTYHGVKREVPGTWTHTTVRALCMNRAILGLLDYGRRSEGKHRRLGKDGPRAVDDSERNGSKKVKRIFNHPSLMTTSKLPMDPKFDPGRWEKIQAETEKRGKIQRGIPRTRDPARYPLSCRVVDLSDGCRSTMYGRTDGKRRVYVCGRYMATGGAECEKNTVDGEALLRFTLDTLLELTDRLDIQGRLREKLLERARRDQPDDPFMQHNDLRRASQQALVADLDRQLKAAKRNLATEESPEYREAIREEFGRIKSELDGAQAQLEAIPQARPSAARTPEEEVSAAMSLLGEIRRVAEDEHARADILQLTQRLGVRIGLRFVDAVKGRKRHVRRLVGGVIIFGNVPFPADGNDGGGQGGSPRGPQGPCGPLGPNENECELGKNRLDTKKASRGSELPLEAGRSETCPREGVSITKGSRGERI